MEDKLLNTEEVLSQIRKGRVSRETVIRKILCDLKYKNSIIKIVSERGGSHEDVVFVLHHTLVAFMKQVLKNRNLKIEGSIYSYLNGIAKFIWLGELRKMKKLAERESHLDYETHEMASESFELDLLHREKSANLLEVLSNVGEKCKKVLMLWSAGYSMKEIAIESGYNSEGVARKKKFQCMKALSAYLDNNPNQKEMLR